MSKMIEIKVPDIGDFKNVEIIEVHVKSGDRIQKEQPLITLESDKASLDIPSPQGGVVANVHVKVGDRVSEGDPILTLEVAGETVGAAPAAPERKTAGPAVAPATIVPFTGPIVRADVVVLGAGPGGYTAAFRAADLGKKVVLVERYPTLGGVCLNVGCIPSKALLHVARVIAEIKELREAGIDLGNGKPDARAIRTWSEKVVARLTGGLRQMAKQRGVEVLQGAGRFTSPHELRVESGNGVTAVSFDAAIIAAGSQAARLPLLPEDARILDSTSALKLDPVPQNLLVIGGGIIGLEMATVYHALGSKITVVELLNTLIADCDPDIVRPLHKRIEQRYEKIYLGTKVTAVKPVAGGFEVTFEGKGAPERARFDAILVAVGRKPNGHAIGAEQAGVRVDDRGFIPVDDEQRTNVPHIFAIGDITGPPMLAHKASHEGKVAAEVAAGLKSGFDNRVIPSVAYTDPEIAWVGVTENEARARNIDYGKGMFPWAASGRSLTLGRDDGLTKLLFDKSSGRLIGAAMVGPNAGDLIAEAALAIEMSCDARDVGLTIHPHPTLSETVGMAAEAFEGTITDLYLPRKEPKARG
jgi:dihydrolipoamide dehydrogenase